MLTSEGSPVYVRGGGIKRHFDNEKNSQISRHLKCYNVKKKATALVTTLHKPGDSNLQTSFDKVYHGSRLINTAKMIF